MLNLAWITSDLTTTAVSLPCPITVKLLDKVITMLTKQVGILSYYFQQQPGSTNLGFGVHEVFRNVSKISQPKSIGPETN